MKRHAFTLLELLVALAILAILGTLIATVTGRIRRSGAMAREIAAGRQLVGAYLNYAGENDGKLMVGYSAKEQAVDDRGEPVINPACGRYPWRLAPYLTYRLRGTMLVNEQEAIADLKDHADFVYRASAYPSLGINATYVGGNERSGLIPSPATLRYYGDFVATRLAQVAQPSKLLVFASARSTGEDDRGEAKGEIEHGFHLLTPPRTTKVDWSGRFDEKAAAGKFGNLDLRYGGKAVCVMLGGNVELLDERQLQDMRYWSAQAAEADEASFTVKPIQ